MSINHYYYSSPIPSDQFPETHLWSTEYNIMQSKTPSSPSPKHPTNSYYVETEDDFRNMTSSSNSKRSRNCENDGEEPKIALFEKSLTPSDVGKLNRLVIPKQHAERYFPLNGGIINTPSSHDVVNEKGLLLSFEDDEDEQLVKTWRFRYSYWNSSQSYVLTKGWSRFVKDKKLQAGDIVVFFRHRLDHARLFIGWRRRNTHPTPEDESSTPRSKDVFCYPTHYHQSSSDRPNLFTLPTPAAAGSVIVDENHGVTSSGNCRKLRLFGVNMECQLPDESSEASDSPVAEPEEAQRHYYNHLYSNYYNQMG